MLLFIQTEISVDVSSIIPLMLKMYNIFKTTNSNNKFVSSN